MAPKDMNIAARKHMEAIATKSKRDPKRSATASFEFKAFSKIINNV